jgi:hypothetical protein
VQAVVGWKLTILCAPAGRVLKAVLIPGAGPTCHQPYEAVRLVSQRILPGGKSGFSMIEGAHHACFAA